MTIAELIAELQKYPQTMPVVRANEDVDYGETFYAVNILTVKTLCTADYVSYDEIPRKDIDWREAYEIKRGKQLHKHACLILDYTYGIKSENSK